MGFMTVSYGVIIPGHSVIETDPDLVLPHEADIMVDDSDLDFELTVTAVYDTTLRRYVADSVAAQRRGMGMEINGSSLRELRIQEYIRDGLSGVFEVKLADGSTLPYALSPEQRAQAVSAGPFSDDTLLWVARVYRAAEVLNMRPAKAVQDQLGLTQPTASLWIRRARERGIMVER